VLAYPVDLHERGGWEVSCYYSAMTFFIIIIIILFWSYFFACRQDPDSFSVYWPVYISFCIICLHWWWICVRMQRKISSFFASKSSREDEVSPTEVAESPLLATVSPGPEKLLSNTHMISCIFIPSLPLSKNYHRKTLNKELKGPQGPRL
jgi:hypothetical protein